MTGSAEAKKLQVVGPISLKNKNKKKERREIELKMQMHVTEIFIPNSRCMLGPYFRLANHKQF